MIKYRSENKLQKPNSISAGSGGQVKRSGRGSSTAGKQMLCALAMMSLCLYGLASTTRPLLPIPTHPAPHIEAAPANPAHFTFVLTGDNRATGRGVPMPPTAGQIFNEIRLLQPAFTLWTGDAIYGSDDSLGEAEAEYNTFLDLASKAATPIYNVPGNHEIYDRADLAGLYELKMGRLYGSFDYGNSHFISVDTEEVGVKGGVGIEQMKWLEEDLSANKNAAHIFAFMHHPIFPTTPKEGFDSKETPVALHKLFLKYGVKNVFSGHEHLYNKAVHDGITYWISGGAGAPTTASPEKGGFQHYIVLTVDGDKVSAVVVQPWRLFGSVGTNAADGSASGLLSNYDDADMSMCLEFSANGVSADAFPAASWSYKGGTHALDAVIVSSRMPGVVTVRVVVPAHRSAFVTLHPKSMPTK